MRHGTGEKQHRTVRLVFEKKISSISTFSSFNLDDKMGPMRHQTNGLTLSVPTKEETSEQETTNPRRLSVLDESALREDDTNLDRDQRITMITQSYQDILKSIGEDPTRQGFILSLISVHHWLLK